MRNISNSEVSTWLACRQMYQFAFMLEITPKVTPTPLARGTLGHLAFQTYIEARLNSSNHQQALKAVENVWINALKEGISVDIAIQTQEIFNRYMAFHEGWPEWKLLGTEERLDLSITDEITIPIRYDVMVEEVKSSKILVGDWKFTYDFWSPDDHALNAQAPKYITIMNSNGYDVAGGFLAELRTRTLGAQKMSDKRNLWRHTYYYPSLAKKRNMMKQHIAAALEIIEYRDSSPEEQEAMTIPLLSKHGACKFCNFKELCASKLDGKDISFDIEHGYVKNTYGYNKTEIEDIL